jgi:hypothetical protein
MEAELQELGRSVNWRIGALEVWWIGGRLSLLILMSWSSSFISRGRNEEDIQLERKWEPDGKDLRLDF